MVARMVWSEGDVWSTVVKLPPGEHEFKVCVSPLCDKSEGGGVDRHGGLQAVAADTRQLQAACAHQTR